MTDASPDLLRQVRARLVQQGTSLSKWCSENGIKRQWATAVLVGRRNGPAARAMRDRLVEETSGQGI